MDRQEIKDAPTARKYYEAGFKAEKSGQRMAAIEAYEAAFTADPDDPEICFRLAWNLDLVGEEDEAIHLYEQCVQQPNPPLAGLLNLAVLYDDRGQFAKAERCIRQVLATDPNHNRARLFLKDIEASTSMVIEEEGEHHLDQHSAMLETPVTDFELSVRTRNALRKMNIRTLGDLLRITESDLRSYKNVGEASYEEIRSMLSQRGLRLGQSVEQKAAARQGPQTEDADTNAEMFSRSVNELQLSVRARKALSLLNIQTIGDLIARTDAELMGVKNFGLTSLMEIKAKLGQAGLSLRKLEE